MKLKKILIFFTFILIILLVGCANSSYNIKVEDYKYDPDNYSVTVTVNFPKSDKKIKTYGILYELTKVNKITSLNFNLENIFSIEVNADEIEDNKVTFVIENVNKFVQVNFISVRPYVVEIDDILENKVLSTSYKVLKIDGKYTPPIDEPEDPIITEVHISINKKEYKVTTSTKNVTVMIKTPLDYINVYIYIMANQGYTFADDVKIYDGDTLITKGLTLNEAKKQITYKFADPNWTPTY